MSRSAPKNRSLRADVAQALLRGGGTRDAGEVLGHSLLKSTHPALDWRKSSSRPPKQQRRISRLFGAYRPARCSQVARLPCIWKENCSEQFISVDSKGSVSQCDCWVTSYRKYFFGNILREPGLTRMLKTSPARLCRATSSTGGASRCIGF